MRRSGLQRAGTAVEIIHVLNIASPQRDDELGHGFGLLRWQQQVRVIRHRYIRVQRTFRLAQGFTQPMQVTVVFILGGEALPIVAALHDMKWNVVEMDTGASGHFCMLPN